MVPIKDAPGHIERILRRSGHDTKFVQQALAMLSEAPEGQKVALSGIVSIINWPTDNAQRDLSRGALLNKLVVVKIAFEFLALMAGTTICDDLPQLNKVRSSLSSQNQECDTFEIERLMAPDYAPFHGICFEGNDPYVKVQVRLFGRLAYRVHFRHLALNGPKIVYTHNLKTGDEDVRKYDA